MQKTKSPSEDIHKMQADAIKRVREMHSRSKSTDGFQNEIQKIDNAAEQSSQSGSNFNLRSTKIIDSPRKNKTYRLHQKPIKNTINLLDSLLKDNDKSLLLILIVLLMDDEENFMLILVLMYLLM